MNEVPVITTFAVMSPQGTLTLHHQTDGAIEIQVREVLRTNNPQVITSTLLGGHAAGPVQQGRLVRILPELEVRSNDHMIGTAVRRARGRTLAAQLGGTQRLGTVRAAGRPLALMPVIVANDNCYH